MSVRLAQNYHFHKLIVFWGKVKLNILASPGDKASIFVLIL